MVWVVALGRLVVWDSIRGTPKVANPFHFLGFVRNPNHHSSPPPPKKKQGSCLGIDEGVVALQGGPPASYKWGYNFHK